MTTTESQQGVMAQARLPAPRAALLRRKRFLIVGLVVAAALGFLGYQAFIGAATYYLTVEELLARSDTAYGEQVRVMGKVVDGSVTSTPETNTIRFAIADKNGTSVPVVYSGVVPDAFKQGADVVLEGNLSRTDTFEASNLLVKCPSKYEAEEKTAPAEGRD